VPKVSQSGESLARPAARSNAVRVGRCPRRTSREPDAVTVTVASAGVEMTEAGMAIRFVACDSANFSVEGAGSRIAEHTTANRLRANRSAT
jgi:hypothetical protein